MRKVWEKKNLPKSDAQQPSDDSNATCNLRLSQAGYKDVDGDKIDQTRYFRESVFRNCTWEETQNGEVTTIESEIEIDGENKGVFELKVTHEPHRESLQDNVTTILHWGDAIPCIVENNITGKTLELYHNDDNSFKISIHE